MLKLSIVSQKHAEKIDIYARYSDMHSLDVPGEKASGPWEIDSCDDKRAPQLGA